MMKRGCYEDGCSVEAVRHLVQVEGGFSVVFFSSFPN